MNENGKYACKKIQFYIFLQFDNSKIWNKWIFLFFSDRVKASLSQRVYNSGVSKMTYFLCTKL